MTDLMKELEGLEQSALDSLNQAQSLGEGVQLPFPVIYPYTLNGDVKQRAMADKVPAVYFGGWSVDQEAVSNCVEDGTLGAFPAGWVSYVSSGDKGDYTNLSSRVISFAPIAPRVRWLGKDGRESGPHYDAARGLVRRHLQYLVQMWIGGAPYGYVVISAKGFQAQNVIEGIKDWDKAISAHRKALNATQIKISGFVVTLGTAGAQPEYVSVGKNATSKITPIKAIINPDLTAEQVAKRFIGAPNLRANAERLEMARDWLAAWSKGEAAGPVADPGFEPAPVVDENW